MRHTPVFIVCSPRPLVGKTLLARMRSGLLVLKNGKGGVSAFDINLKEPSLLEYVPDITETAEVDTTFGQMALMDRVILNDGIAKVIDLGFHAFDEFFKMSGEIGFFKEAARRGISPLIAPGPRRAAIRCCSSRSPRRRLSPSITSSCCAASCRPKWPMAGCSAS